jgi:hypothetical protein
MFTVSVELFLLSSNSSTFTNYLDLPALFFSTDSSTLISSSATRTGLIVSWWILFVLSSVYQLWTWSGDVEKAWDNYLSNRLDAQGDEKGVFEPYQSWWFRLLTRRERRSGVFTDLPTSERNRKHPWDDRDSDEADMEKGGSSSDWESDVDTVVDKSNKSRKKKVKGAAKLDLTTAPVVRYQDIRRQIEFEDVDDDSVNSFSSAKFRPEGPDSPPVLASTPTSPYLHPIASQATNPVPATPSLIQALERINIAQKQARGARNHRGGEGQERTGVQLPERRMSQRLRGESWDEWWTNKVEKSETV